jgi:hypothetical protein
VVSGYEMANGQAIIYRRVPRDIQGAEGKLMAKTGVKVTW